MPGPIFSSLALTIANDNNYAVISDPKDNTPTKVTPGAGLLLQGARPRRQLAAQHRNWIDNQFAQVMLQLIADGETDRAEVTTHRRHWESVPALNFYPPTTSSATLAKFVNGLWYLSGAADDFGESDDIGDLTPLGAIPAGLGNDNADFDVSPLGNIVVLDDGVDNFKVWDGATWTLDGFDGETFEKPTVVFEPVSEMWCIVSRYHNDQQPRIFTSDVGAPAAEADWTARTPPAGWNTGGYYQLGHNGLGRIVAMRHGQSGNVQFAYSDDGGVTWSDQQTLTMGFTPATAHFFWPRPVYNPTTGKWLAVTSDGSGSGGDSAVFGSDDGATWTKLVEFVGTAAFRRVACVGRVWLGIYGNNGLAISTDDGATWRKIDVKAVNPLSLVASQNRFLLVGNGGGAAGESTPSHALGLGGPVIPTA